MIRIPELVTEAGRENQMTSILVGYGAMLAVGLLLGVIGGGGSILTLPILVYLLGISPTLASGYSLFIVGVTALFGAFNYARLQLIDYRTGAIFAFPSFIGVYLTRKLVVPSIPDDFVIAAGVSLSRDGLIMTVFALVMLVAAVAMLRKSEFNRSKTQSKYFLAIIGLEGLVVGAVTGFVGAGGGFLIIPALVMLAGLEMKKAVGTSLMIISFKSIFGFLGELGNGYNIDYSVLIWSTVLGVIGIFVGARIARNIGAEILKTSFGWFVLAMGAFILVNQLLFS